MVGFFFEKNPMTNKIKKFLYILVHLIPDGRDEIPTFALYHPLLSTPRPESLFADTSNYCWLLLMNGGWVQTLDK